MCYTSVEVLQINELEERLWSLSCSLELKNICSNFATLFDEQYSSGIVAKVWNDACPRDITNLRNLSLQIWPDFLSQLQEIAVNLTTLNLSCADAAKFLNSQVAVEELNCLQCALHKCQMLKVSEVFKPVEVMQKLLLLEGIANVENEARTLLELKNNHGLTGDFDLVVKISQVCNRL